MAKERIEADQVKRSTRFTVILGNPPYSGHSANKGAWIKNLLHGRTDEGKVENYFSIGGESLNEKNPKWLNDDYVKFTRLAHWQIERTGQGILGFITNHGYLDNPTFRGMRESIVSTFSTQYLLDLHGNSTKKEHSPDGSKDENVFYIKQGVAVGIFVKTNTSAVPYRGHFDLWGMRESADGSGKYDFLENNSVQSITWKTINPSLPYYFLIPFDYQLHAEYEFEWKLSDFFPSYSVGLLTTRDKITIQFTKHRMKSVADHFASLEVEEARSFYHLSRDSADWKVALAQKDIKDHQGKVRPILYRPFIRAILTTLEKHVDLLVALVII